MLWSLSLAHLDTEGKHFGSVWVSVWLFSKIVVSLGKKMEKTNKKKWNKTKTKTEENKRKTEAKKKKKERKTTRRTLKET